MSRWDDVKYSDNTTSRVSRVTRAAKAAGRVVRPIIGPIIDAVTYDQKKASRKICREFGLPSSCYPSATVVSGAAKKKKKTDNSRRW